MQQYAYGLLVAHLIAVNSVLYFSVSLHQCSTFVIVLRLCALCRTYTCVVSVWFACKGCGVYIYMHYTSLRFVLVYLYNITETCMSPSATCSVICTYIVNVCNNTLLHAFNFG